MFKLPNTNFDFKRLLICKRVTISSVSLSTQLKLSLYFSKFGLDKLTISQILPTSKRQFQ